MLAAAVAVAIAFWGPPPCQVAVHVTQLEPPLGGVAWVYPDERCRVEIDARRWKFWELCAVVVHEYGHVHGRSHSEDPLDVMYREIWRPADPCRGKRPPQFPRGAEIQL